MFTISFCRIFYLGLQNGIYIFCKARRSCAGKGRVIMNKIAQSMTDLIGGTPLLEAGRFLGGRGGCRLLAKLEYLNPAGSVKDRAALYMIEDACRAGRLQPGGLIIEPTSGNTGIGLAAVAAARGYRVLLTMPDTMSVERRTLLKAYGAEIVLTPGSEGMAGAIAKAEELQKENPGSLIVGQFSNPANARAHYETTGPELWRQAGGQVDVFIAGVGSGGTVTGAGRYLKEQDPGVRVVAVEPAGSPMLSEGKAGPHGLQGIGAGFIPELLDTGVYDQVVTITEEEAYAASREFAQKEGVLVGISSGAALSAARKLAAQPEYAGKVLAVLLPDTGDRYLSTALFGGE